MIPNADTFAAARCAGRYDEWSTEPLPGETRPERRQRLQAVATECRRCPALDECRTLTDRTPRSYRRWAVWAGRIPQTRRNEP